MVRYLGDWAKPFWLAHRTSRGIKTSWGSSPEVNLTAQKIAHLSHRNDGQRSSLLGRVWAPRPSGPAAWSCISSVHQLLVPDRVDEFHLLLLPWCELYSRHPPRHTMPSASSMLTMLLDVQCLDRNGRVGAGRPDCRSERYRCPVSSHRGYRSVGGRAHLQSRWASRLSAPWRMDLPPLRR